MLHDTANARQRKHLLQSASKEQIRTLCECAFNILRKNVPLKKHHVTQLRKKKNRRLVYQLADKSIPLAKKRDLVVQSGGFPFALLAPIIGEVLSAVVAAAAAR